MARVYRNPGSASPSVIFRQEKTADTGDDAVRLLDEKQRTSAKKANTKLVKIYGAQWVEVIQRGVGAPQTGEFDDDTVDAIAAFQQQRGLTANGVISVAADEPGATLEELSVLAREVRESWIYAAIVFNTNKKLDPTFLATASASLGITLTGTFDKATIVAIADFQRNNAESVDGKIGSGTAKKLKKPKPSAAWIGAAIEHNDGVQFRIDWVRKLQTYLLGAAISEKGEFDEPTIVAITDWQKANGLQPNGKIDALTRRALENDEDSPMYEPLVGPNLFEAVLVDGTLGPKTQFELYKAMVADGGGVFLTGPNDVNLLGIRGVALDADGTLRRTDSAADFAAAQAAGEKDDHFSSKTANPFDDVVVTMWQDTVDQQPTYHIAVRRGAVDPNIKWEKDGTAHLRDGQYEYEVGFHTTREADHQTALDDQFGIDDSADDAKQMSRAKAEERALAQAKADAVAAGANPDEITADILEVAEPVVYCQEVTDGDVRKVKYPALRSGRRIEVWREHTDENDLHISEAERLDSERNVAHDEKRYRDQDDISINIHTSPSDAASSEGCINIPVDVYEEFMAEVDGRVGDAKNGRIVFTLIDASKISHVCL